MREDTSSVSSLSLVRYRGTIFGADGYGHRKVLVRGYVPRSYRLRIGGDCAPSRLLVTRGFRVHPLHYLALIAAEDQRTRPGRAAGQLDVPDEFATMRRLLEARMGKSGKREFVQILR